MLRKMRQFLTGKEGATAIEYGLIAALVSVAAIGALEAMGGKLSDMFTTVENTIADTIDSSGSS